MKWWEALRLFLTERHNTLDPMCAFFTGRWASPYEDCDRCARRRVTHLPYGVA